MSIEIDAHSRFVADDLIYRVQALDLFSVAQLHFYKSMQKSKRMSAAPTFPSYISAKIEAASRPPDIASCNVQARLFNTDVVKTSMAEVMNSVGSLLGIPSGTVSGKKGRLRASDIGRTGGSAKNGDAIVEELQEHNTKKEQNIPQINQMSILHNADQVKIARSDEGSDDYDAYASRLGSSSDDASTEADQEQESLKEEMMVQHEFARTASFSSSYSTSPSTPAHPNPERSHIPTTIPKSTAFLPTLTLGGYISDSDSEHSEAPDAPELRKNRRGQRARRQIWEKKFGHSAKHLQVQARSQDRDRDWDPRAGARPTDDRSRGRREKGQGPIRRGRAGPLSSGANADPVKARPIKGENKGKQAAGPLHPSWEAAKRAKEATKSVAFQGKKLVFD